MFVDLAGEEWRMIPGYEGLYEVSNMGRVRSWSIRGSHIRRRASEPRLKTLTKEKTGRMRVDLQFGRAQHFRGVLVHFLVMLAFIGPRPSGMVIRHRDGNPGNNRRENLLYGTQLENVADSIGHGTIARGRNLPQAKLDEEKVSEIRQRCASGETIGQLAREFGISWSTCQDVVLGITWAHIDRRIEIRT